MNFETHLNKIKNGKSLSIQEMQDCFSAIFSDNLADDQIQDFLIALYEKGETVDELVGAVQFLREHGTQLQAPFDDCIDCCGTGGDQRGTFNISTAVAFVLAGGDCHVAKHGNRAVSSKSGSADVLEALGINLQLSNEQSLQALKEIGISFFFAPNFYPILKKVGALRKQIPHRTIFNLLGPLLNPVNAKCQLIGVYNSKYVPILAEALKKLESQSAVVVSSNDGLDEFSLTSSAQVSQLQNNEIKNFEFDPRISGYDFCNMESLLGANAEDNAYRLKQTLKGHSKPIDHVVHINAAWGFVVAGKVDTFLDGLLMAQDSISSGRAYQKLQALSEWSQSQS